MSDTLLPMAHFAGAGEPLTPADEVDDDEQLAETPTDIVMMLGFDPATDEEFNDEDAEEAVDQAQVPKAAQPRA